ncbi:MAG TPA: TonB family protein [Burkholderiales bacterium]|nr:TonB family protein [Burkholderiales bacterium]
MAGAAAPLIVAMPRDRANRSFGLALLASVLLHALLLAAAPSLRELAAQLPQVPAPLVARLMQPQAKPSASAPAEAPRKAPAPEKRAAPPPPAAKPAPPPPPVAKAPVEPVAAPPPVPALQSAPAPAMQAATTSPAPSATAAPVPAASLPALGPLARFEPVPAPAASPGPDPGALDRYRLQLVTVAARFKRYPLSAIDNNWEGVVVVRMTIGRDGGIAALGVARSSGHEVLDRQALEMFRTAKPFVQLPPELAGREFELELRAIYSLRDQPSG